MDVYKWGQEDEGQLVTEDVGNAWLDNDDGEPSPVQSDQEEAKAEAKEEAALALARDAPDEVASQVEQALEKLAAMDRVLETVRAVEGISPYVLGVLEKARSGIAKQTHGRYQVDSRVAAALSRIDATRQACLESAQVKMRQMRENIKEAKEKKRKIEGEKEEFRKQRRAFKEQTAREERRIEVENASKGFDAKDLGQGQLGGGTAAHGRARRDMLDRVRRLWPRLPPEQLNQWDRFAKHWDSWGCQQYGGSWGSRFRNTMEELIKRASQADEQPGRPELQTVFARWMQNEFKRRKVPSGEVVVPAAKNPDDDDLGAFCLGV